MAATELQEDARLLAIADDDSWAHMHRGEADALFSHDETYRQGMQYFDDAGTLYLPVTVDEQIQLAAADEEPDLAGLEQRLRKVLEHSAAMINEQLLFSNALFRVAPPEPGDAEYLQLLALMESSPYTRSDYGVEQPETHHSEFLFGEGQHGMHHRGSPPHMLWHQVRKLF